MTATQPVNGFAESLGSLVASKSISRNAFVGGESTTKFLSHLSARRSQILATRSAISPFAISDPSVGAN